MDLFSFIANRINLNKMRKESAEGLIRHIISCIDDKDDRKAMNDRLSFLFICAKIQGILIISFITEYQMHFAINHLWVKPIDIFQSEESM